MTTIDTRPQLRLVGTDAGFDPPAHRAVVRENRAAADNLALDPADPRWALAVRAYSQLDGSSLTFDRRQNLMRTARQLGVRPFDANIIVAIVQDHARRGQKLDQAAGTIALLDPPAAQRSPALNLSRWFTAVACAATATAFLIWWVQG